jgi:ribosomal protein L11 methylase PrmA
LCQDQFLAAGLNQATTQQSLKLLWTALHCVDLPAGRTCIELGCGPGLVAACTARLQPACLLLTDGDPQTLVNCSSNMALNGHSVRPLGCWQQGAQLLDQKQQQQQLGGDLRESSLVGCVVCLPALGLK